MTSLIEHPPATPLPVARSNAQDRPAYGGGPGATPYSSAGKPGRVEFVDALRVVLIALVVAHHSVEAYVVGYPPEVPLPDAPIPRAWVFLWVNAAFFMGLFFFLAGCFTPGAFDRKGVTNFLADRGLRLGVPLVLGTVLIVPLAGWSHIALDPALPKVGYWTYLTQDFFGHGPKPDFWPARERWPAFNFGHLWFLEHLLVYALLYAAMRAFLARDTGKRYHEPPSHLAIAAYALLLAAATFVIRISYPQNRWIGFLGFIQMEPAHIPQYASLFVIGLFAGPRRWLETMPTRRGLIWLAIGGGLAIMNYLLVGFGIQSGSASGNWRVCIDEAFLCVSLCIGLPVLFRELKLGAGRLWRVLADNVFAVYVFHFPIVLLLQWALIDAPVPKWVRLVATVVGAIVGSFAFTNWFILRLPYSRRVF
jgi:glucans biosynthesis protein C